MTTAAATEAVELAASAGLHLDPWQQHALHVALGERADGKWAARQFGLIVPRQNGKGSVIEAVELAALFLFDEQLVMHSAHEFKTAAEAYLRIKGLIEETPDLDRLVKRYYNSHGQEGIELKSGARLRFVARSGGSGRGFSGDRIILDEAYNLWDSAISALAFTMGTRPNPQVWFTSSAPLDTEPSAVLRRYCKRGREGDPDLAYIEYCALESDDTDDPAATAAANPGYPSRIDEEAVALERSLATEEDFRRERLGIVNLDAAAAEHVIDPTVWADCLNTASEVTGTPTFALEIDRDRTYSCIAAAGVSSLGEFVHGQSIRYEAGSAWCVDAAKELHDQWNLPIVVQTGTPAAALIPQLEAAGVPVREVSTEEHARACGQFFDMTAEGRFRHIGQGELDTSVRNAVKKDQGSGAFVWDRKKPTVDVSPLVAVTLAAYVHGLPEETSNPQAVWL